MGASSQVRLAQINLRPVLHHYAPAIKQHLGGNATCISMYLAMARLTSCTPESMQNSLPEPGPYSTIEEENGRSYHLYVIVIYSAGQTRLRYSIEVAHRGRRPRCSPRFYTSIESEKDPTRYRYATDAADLSRPRDERTPPPPPPPWARTKDIAAGAEGAVTTAAPRCWWASRRRLCRGGREPSIFTFIISTCHGHGLKLACKCTQTRSNATWQSIHFF